jgi:hypothetical protein
MQRSMIMAVVLIAGSLFSELAQAQTPATMPANSWLAAPNTKLEDVAADTTEFPGIEGNGFYTIVDAWNGAVLDTQRTRLVIWGGGHNDYYGNEMYVFDIAGLTWSRITDPTVDWSNCSDPNSDGTPNSRHTYNGLAYIAHADRMFASGGALNCMAGGCGANLTWAFDFTANEWNDRQPTGTHTTGCENNAAYDPASKRVYFGDAYGLHAYSYDDNAWTKLNDDNIYGMTSTIDTQRGLLVMAGNDEVWAYDIGAQDFTKQVWVTTGGDAFLADASPGFAYDPTTDRLVGWDGGPVYVLDPESKAFTTYDPPGAPERTEQGIFGRWRYVPTVNAFILVTGTDTDVHFFKLSDGGSLPPPVDAGTGGSGGSGGVDGGVGGTSGASGTGGGSGGASGAGALGGSTSTGGSGTGANAGTGAKTGATPSVEDDSGCGCRLARSNGASLLALVGAGLGLAAARTRRRRRR